MATQVISLPQNRSIFNIVVSLEGEDYQFDFRWNNRASKWFFRILDSEGTEIQGSTKFVVNYPLTALTKSESLFPGTLWAIDLTGAWQDATLREIGNRVEFQYQESTS